MNAIFYLASGNYEAAVTALDSVIAAAPTVAFYRAHRGYALAQTGDVSGAMWAFQEALLLDDRSAEVYFQRAAVKSNLGDARGALTDLRLAVELDPDDYRFHLLRARSFLLTRDYDGAYEAAEASVATSGDQCAECYLTAGVVRFTIGVPGDVETGCQYLSRAGELGSEEAYGYIGEWCGPAR